MLNKLLYLLISVAATTIAYHYGTDVVFYTTTIAFISLYILCNVKSVLHTGVLSFIKLYLIYIDIKLWIQREAPLNERRNAILERRILNSKRSSLKSSEIPRGDV